MFQKEQGRRAGSFRETRRRFRSLRTYSRGNPAPATLLQCSEGLCPKAPHRSKTRGSSGCLRLDPAVFRFRAFCAGAKQNHRVAPLVQEVKRSFDCRKESIFIGKVMVAGKEGDESA